MRTRLRFPFAGCKTSLLLRPALLWGAASLFVSAKAQVPADTLGRELREVTVSATHDKTVKSTAPTFRLDSERMKRLGVTDISGAMHRLPGVVLKDYGGAGGMKTVGVRGYGAAHTAVIYDGIPLGDTRSGEIDISRYSIDNLSGVSLVIGDNDDIFIPARSAASAASLSISSASAVPDDGHTDLVGQMRVGSFGYLNPYLRVGKRLSDRVGLNFTGEFIHARNDYPFTLVNGTVVTRERRNNSRMNSGHVELNTVVSTGSRSELTSKIYYYDNNQRLPGPVILYNDKNNERLRTRNAFAQATHRSVLSPMFSLLLNGKFNWSESLYHDEKDSYPGGVRDQNYWQREAYASAALLCIPAEGWAVDYSADYVFNNMTSNLPTDVRPYRHTVLQSLTGRFRNDRLTATARILGSVYQNGAKDGEGARNYARLSPSVSLSVAPLRSEALFVRVSYKNIFRMPTFNESYFYRLGSPTLKPETTHNLNLGLTWQAPTSLWLASALFTVDGYVNFIRDKIVAVPYNMFIWSMVNLSKARVTGCDLTANLNFVISRPHNLLVAGNYSLQVAKNRTAPESSEYDKQIAYIPVNSGSCSVSYENPWVNLSVTGSGVSCRYTTATHARGTRISGYMEFGASLYRSFPLRSHSIELRADIVNMFDKQYEVIARYPMPGRSFRFAVRFTL